MFFLKNGGSWLMCKIYQFIASVQLGGAENVAINLAQFCPVTADNNGVDKEIIIMELYPTNNEYASLKKKELESKNIPVLTLFNGSKRMSLIFGSFKLVKFIRKEKPKVIHSHTDLPDFVLSLALHICNFLNIETPSVVRTIHNTQLWRTHNLFGKISESAYKDEKVTAVSNLAMSAYEQLRIKYDMQPSQYRKVLYNGSPIPERKSHPFKIDNNKINIAYCGRFEDYKGMETLMPAIVEVEKRFPSKFLFHVIGDGTYKNQLRELSEKCSNMIMYEPVPDVSSYFHAFDYIFMPSHFEGLALISIESSLSGVPVIASIAPGLDETLPIDWPLRFNLKNPEELYTLFNRIINKQFNYKMLKEEAFNFASKEFALESMVESYSNIYEEIV